MKTWKVALVCAGVSFAVAACSTTEERIGGAGVGALAGAAVAGPVGAAAGGVTGAVVGPSVSKEVGTSRKSRRHSTRTY